MKRTRIHGKTRLDFYIVRDPEEGDENLQGHTIACCEDHAREHADATSMAFIGRNTVDPRPVLSETDGCDVCGWDFEE